MNRQNIEYVDCNILFFVNILYVYNFLTGNEQAKH